MRKILIVLTLIVSSFFISNNNVKADTTTYVVQSVYFDYIDEDFFTLRELAIEFATTNNKYYLIKYESYYNVVYFFDKGDYSVTYNSSVGQIYLNIPVGGDRYILSDGSLKKSGSSTNLSQVLVGSSSSTIFKYFNFIDTNIEDLKYTGTKSFIIQYNDLSYSIEQVSSFPSLYQIYLDDNYVEPEIPEEPIEDEHAEEKEIISNFYTTVITKIGDFTNNVFNNYILLSVIGIFIFIFVFELIFRRLL